MNEILLYAILTVVVGGLLYSVLGKNIGQDPEHGDDKRNSKDILENFMGNITDDNKHKPPESVAPSYDGPGANGIKQILAADRGFNPDGFLDGAKGAYGMILEAFAARDKDTLENLLTPSVKDTYYAAIDNLADKGLTQTTDLARLIDADIVDARLVGKIATIDVAYFAELATAIKNDEGDILEGDLDILSRVREIWSFERTVGSNNPNWRLSGVEPHTSNTATKNTPDHSPDT